MNQSRERFPAAAFTFLMRAAQDVIDWSAGLIQRLTHSCVDLFEVLAADQTACHAALVRNDYHKKTQGSEKAYPV
jgi:hypothetical protein